MSLAELTTERDWLAERGYVVGARVGHTAFPHQLGTIVRIENRSAMVVRWDDGRHYWYHERHIAPLGYVAPGCQVCGEPHGVSVPCGYRREVS